jgi:hypothetical protein
MVERMGLDAVNQLARLALCWDEIEPPPRKHSLLGQADDTPGKHVEPAEIVQKPAIVAELPDGRLNRWEVEHGNTPELLLS